MAYSQPYDIAIIGSGIAGLSVALRLPDSIRIALFTKGQLGESNTRYAQGGLAAALGSDDSPELHFQDTLAAGAGLCDEKAVRILVEEAPAAVKWLIAMGVQFDRVQSGSASHATGDGLLLGREAAHSRWRVLHAGGDASGAEIERALVTALGKRSSVVLYEDTFVSDLLVQDGVCMGVQAVGRDGHAFTIESRVTVLANGGAGSLWLHTSNPSGATADGLAVAWRAGAALTDLEFMQFHPTVLVGNGGSHLISEAVRGEGAYLRNHAGERFMLKYHAQAELAPRDVVARAILSEMLCEQAECQYLDLRHLPAELMYTRFPTISAVCRNYSLDLAKDLLPVAPAAHYCMGGVMVDTEGRTTLQRLYAVGEVACTGVHGANRLASNSLLEGLVFGLRLADTLVKLLIETNGTHEERISLPEWHTKVLFRGRFFADDGSNELQSRRGEGSCDMGQRSLGSFWESPAVEVSTMPMDVELLRVQRELRQVMWQYVSLCRDQEGLLEAICRLDDLWQTVLDVMHHTPTSDACGYAEVVPSQLEIVNMLQVAEIVIAAALQRCESRGSHWRSDYDTPDEALSHCHYVFTREDIGQGRGGDVEQRILEAACGGVIECKGGVSCLSY